jgi:hypothetical protein
MTRRGLQIFSAALLVGSFAFGQAAALQPGHSYRFALRDVDGNDLSTADGHVTIITVITRQNEPEAHAVADLVPDRYVGDAKCRYVTLVNFQRSLAGPFQGLTRAVIRSRLDGEAKQLKPHYDAKKITRDPRHDLYVVADFDGSAVAHLGLAPEANDVVVFVFNGSGKLVNRWTGVPPGNALPEAIAAAEK